MITSDYKKVYNAVVDVMYTGDTDWHTAFSVTGCGRAEIHVSFNPGVQNGQLKITLDGAVLINGFVGYSNACNDHCFEIEYNVSLLVEAKTTDAANETYVEINYFNN